MQMFQPTEWSGEDARLTRFMDLRGFSDISDLGAWARRAPEAFWRAVAEEVGLAWDAEWTALRDAGHGGWFPDARINPYENLLGLPASVAPDRLALSAINLAGQREERTFAEMAAEVARIALAVGGNDLQPGEQVLLALPDSVESWTIGLALMCLGVTVVRPRAVEARGRRRLAVVQRARASRYLAASAERWMFVEDLVAAPRTDWAGRSIAAGRGGWIGLGEDAGDGPGGAPSVTEWMLKAAWDLVTTLDVREGDVIMVVAGAQWPLWPWLCLGAQKLGAGVVACAAPALNRVEGWQLLERHGVTHLLFLDGVLEALFASGVGARGLPEGALRVLGVIGGRLSRMAWLWLFHGFGGCRLPVVTLIAEGGLGGAALAAFPGYPAKPCAVTGPVPGVDLDVGTDDSNEGALRLGHAWPALARSGGQLPTVGVDADGYWFLRDAREKVPSEARTAQSGNRTEAIARRTL